MRYVALMTGIAVVVVLAFSAWSYFQQTSQAEEQMLAEARVLNASVNAAWDFVEFEQDNINYDRDGVYNFKGIYCSLVGKSVGRLFSIEMDYRYELSYTRDDPRNARDAPDEFEQAALDQFNRGGVSEYYDIVTNEEGQHVFRYVAAIYLEENCMDCHGGVKGEIDVTGFEKEGMAVGDLGGAVSIVMPTDLYRTAIDTSALRTVLLFVLFLSIVLGSSALFFRRCVTAPIAKLEDAMAEIGQGNLKIDLGEVGGSREVSDLAAGVESMARELDALYTTLEDKVAERTRLFQQANETLAEQREQIAHANSLLTEANAKLQEENEYRTNIIAILSHELRTPLTAILAFVDLWEASPEEHSEEDRDCIEKIRSHALTLLEMVNNVLDMAKIEAGAVEVASRTLDLVDLVEEAAQLAEPLARQKSIEIAAKVDDDVPLIKSDWSQIQKILGNLVSNAVKFTDEGGHVALHASYDGAAGCVALSVSDDGIGIAQGDLEGIFNRFVQVDSTPTRKYSGSGLGLSLVKRTTEMLGGRVEVESELGRGSTFTVVLPVTVVEEDDFDEDLGCR